MSKQIIGKKASADRESAESGFYGAKEREVLREAPAEPEATGFRRRTFLKGVAAVAAAGTVRCSPAANLARS